MAVFDRGPRCGAFVVEDLGEREPAVVTPEAKLVAPGAEDVGHLLASQVAKFRLVMRTFDEDLGDADARVGWSGRIHAHGRVAVWHNANAPAGAVLLAVRLGVRHDFGGGFGLVAFAEGTKSSGAERSLGAFGRDQDQSPGQRVVPPLGRLSHHALSASRRPSRSFTSRW